MVRILLVEDDEMSRDMMSRRLMRRGYDVITAADGREAIRQAATAGPDLILMDISLPEIDGLEITRRLRAGQASSAIPIIALTAHAMSEDRERIMQAGCNDYESKPADLVRLLAKMERHLSSA